MSGRAGKKRALQPAGRVAGSAVIRLWIVGAAALSLSYISEQVRAEEIGNREMGARLASEVCAECHAVLANDQDSPNLDAPAFQTIADRSATTALALGVWFRSPHPTMPNFVLTPEETSNLIAYILSLREKQ